MSQPPRPIAEVPALDASKVKGIVFDIDDTVTSGGILQAVAFEAMHRAHKAGLRLVAVTGRPIGWADVVARTWPVDLAIGENGAGWVWRSGAKVKEGYFCDQVERDKQRAALSKVRASVRKELPHIVESADQWARRCDAAFDVGESVTLPAEDIEALVTLIESHAMKSSVSSVHAHAIPGSWNKANGTERALADALSITLGTELERWVFIGDSGNDAAAFSYFKISVGVANVRHHLHRLPSPPKFITQANHGEGFAELVDQLVLARKGQ